MFLTAHSSAALALSALPLPSFILFPLAFVSHYLVDIIPHGDENLLPDSLTEKQKTKRMLLIALCDGICILALLGVYVLLHPEVSILRISIAAFLACLPDGLQFIEFRTKGRISVLHQHQLIHTKIHNLLHIKIPFIYGIVVQIIFLGLMITWW